MVYFIYTYMIYLLKKIDKVFEFNFCIESQIQWSGRVHNNSNPDKQNSDNSY